METQRNTSQQSYQGHISRRESVSSSYRGDDSSGVNRATSRMRLPPIDFGDNLKTVYVSNILASMPTDALVEAFRQFGRVETIVRRAVSLDMMPNTEQQYAFIRFYSRHDARHAIQAGEINFYGRKLGVRARDKPTPSFIKQGSSGYTAYREGNDRIHRGTQQSERRATNYNQRNYSTANYQQQSYQPPAVLQTEMRSKTLNVANLPPDMSPKDLYDLFTGYGEVERSYIYQDADHLGRRYGEVTMKTYLNAQKACEGLNDFSLRGCLLDVSYKLSHLTNRGQYLATTSQPITNSDRLHPYGMNQPMPWAYQYFPAGGPAYHASASYAHSNTGTQMLYPVWHNGVPATVPYTCVYTGASSQKLSPSLSSNASYIYPHTPHTDSTIFPRMPTVQPNASNGVSFDNLNLDNTSEYPSRSASGTSSTTLVTSHYEETKERNDSPVIVASPTYVDYERPSHSVPTTGVEDHNTYETYSEPTPVVSSMVTPSEINSIYKSQEAPESSSNAKRENPRPIYVPETSQPRDPSNLYIKNLDDECIRSTADLKAIMSPFGHISSAYLATHHSGVSKGYGFVAFVNPDDALKAKEQLDGQVFGRKRIFITFAERREERNQRLKELFESRKQSSTDTTLVLEGLEGTAPDNAQNEFTNKQGNGCANAEAVESQVEGTSTATEGALYADSGKRESLEEIGGNGADTLATAAESVVTVTATVTTQVWRGTKLHGILEVEEEDTARARKLRHECGYQTHTRNGSTASVMSVGETKEPQKLLVAGPDTDTDETSTKIPARAKLQQICAGETASGGSLTNDGQKGQTRQRENNTFANLTGRGNSGPLTGKGGSRKPEKRPSTTGSVDEHIPTGPRVVTAASSVHASGQREFIHKKKKNWVKKSNTPVSDNRCSGFVDERLGDASTSGTLDSKTPEQV